MQTQKVTTIAGSISTVAALCYLTLSSPTCDLYENYFKEIDVKQAIPFYDPNPYYLQQSEEILISSQIETINKVVSFLIERSKNLNPEYSAAVDKYFWDLA